MYNEVNGIMLMWFNKFIIDIMDLGDSVYFVFGKVRLCKVEEKKK